MASEPGFIEPASAQARVAAAAAALEQSRELLVTAVAPKKARPRAAAASAGSSAAAPSAFDAPSSGSTRSTSTLRPMAAAVAAVLRGWWRHHPLRKTVEEVESTGNALIGPHVQRHPALVLAGAAGVGAALVLVFPRRGWALALPWIGMEARSIIRGFWRSWYSRRSPAAPH